MKERPEIRPAEGKLGVLLPGFGAVATTFVAGVEAAGDEPTADLLTQRMQVHEKNAWMLRSLLEQD